MRGTLASATVTVPAETPPHPDPLSASEARRGPASGARERTNAGRDEQERDPAQIARAQIGCGGRS
ncbi:hypothetical protein C7U92_01570 [Bradyrhizobium sp. WBOS7]|nr:hypothetical protein [Bradyrhizobium sp. WBOS2]MDD1571918.1 hypothetical protein [Bradyrhizobium sp. WBOS1]MDD1575422.1 hypothetical protein [Bradyrhizobium sp. WBOS7]